MSNLKVPTRQEYYTAQGFSGSAIDRPDDPIDDEFIRHCNGLKAFANGFIEHCKSGKTSAYAGHLENKVLDVNFDEQVKAIIDATDLNVNTIRDLINVYSTLYKLAGKKITSSDDVIKPDEFAAKAFILVSNFSDTVHRSVAQQSLMNNTFETAKQIVATAKQYKTFEEAIEKLDTVLNT